MFKLRRKKKDPFVTVRTEELEVGDRFVYDNAAVAVLDIIRKGAMVVVRLGTTHAGSCVRTMQVELYPELLVTVARY